MTSGGVITKKMGEIENSQTAIPLFQQLQGIGLFQQFQQ
jgi:hypothetical protein